MEEPGDPEALRKEFSKRLLASLTNQATTAQDSEEPKGSLNTSLDREERDLVLADRKQDTRLKGSYAKVVLGLMLIHVIFTNIVFCIYAKIGHNWEVPESVMHSWLASTVVQLIGLALVVVRYLFPRRT